MNSLVTVLRYGSLPFPIAAVQDSQISATLGAEFLHRSLIAGGSGSGWCSCSCWSTTACRD